MVDTTEMEGYIRASGAPFALAMRRVLHGVPVEEAVKVWEKAKTTVAEGVVSCKKCKSKRVWEKSVQTRSADEGATSFFTCSECKYQWRS